MPVGANLTIERIAMQVEDVDSIKGLHQALAHAAEGGIVQIGGGTGQNRLTALALTVRLCLSRYSSILALAPACSILHTLVIAQ